MTCERLMLWACVCVNCLESSYLKAGVVALDWIRGGMECRRQHLRRPWSQGSSHCRSLSVPPPWPQPAPSCHGDAGFCWVTSGHAWPSGHHSPGYQSSPTSSPSSSCPTAAWLYIPHSRDNCASPVMFNIYCQKNIFRENISEKILSSYRVCLCDGYIS